MLVKVIPEDKWRRAKNALDTMQQKENCNYEIYSYGVLRGMEEIFSILEGTPLKERKPPKEWRKYGEQSGPPWET